jgi:hypothetical protein
MPATHSTASPSPGSRTPMDRSAVVPSSTLGEHDAFPGHHRPPGRSPPSWHRSAAHGPRWAWEHSPKSTSNKGSRQNRRRHPGADHPACLPMACPALHWEHGSRVTTPLRCRRPGAGASGTAVEAMDPQAMVSISGNTGLQALAVDPGTRTGHPGHRCEGEDVPLPCLNADNCIPAAALDEAIAVQAGPDCGEPILVQTKMVVRHQFTPIRRRISGVPGAALG